MQGNPCACAVDGRRYRLWHIVKKNVCSPKNCLMANTLTFRCKIDSLIGTNEVPFLRTFCGRVSKTRRKETTRMLHEMNFRSCPCKTLLLDASLCTGGQNYTPLSTAAFFITSVAWVRCRVEEKKITALRLMILSHFQWQNIFTVITLW